MPADHAQGSPLMHADNLAEMLKAVVRSAVQYGYDAAPDDKCYSVGYESGAVANAVDAAMDSDAVKALRDSLAHARRVGEKARAVLAALKEPNGTIELSGSVNALAVLSRAETALRAALAAEGGSRG